MKVMRQFIYDYRPDVIILNSRYVTTMVNTYSHTHTHTHTHTKSTQSKEDTRTYILLYFTTSYFPPYRVVSNHFSLYYIVLYCIILHSGGQNSLTTAQILTTEIVPEAAEMIRNRARYRYRCAMLCYAVLCYAMLCYAMLCYAMLCYALHCTALHCTALLCKILTFLFLYFCSLRILSNFLY